MQCPSCGADNAADARFCNMCGTRIVAPDPSMASIDAPNAMSMTGSVSLQGIGVQSSRRAYVMLGIAAGIFGVLGAFAMWAVMRSSQASAPETSPSPVAIAQGPVVIGDPIPRGLEPPPVTPEELRRGPRATSGTRGGASGAPVSQGANGRATPASNGTARPRGTSSGATAAAHTGTAGAAGAVGAAEPARPNENGAANGAGPAAGGSAIDRQGADSNGNLAGATGGGSDPGSQTGTSSAGGSAADTAGAGAGPDVPGDAPPEQDLAAELYGARVRRVIRQYYAARAQSCFEHASRNAEVRGTVVIEFTIASEGDVSRANVASNTTGDDALGRCLAAQVSSWHLPGPGTEVDLSIPFSR